MTKKFFYTYSYNGYIFLKVKSQTKPTHPSVYHQDCKNLKSFCESNKHWPNDTSIIEKCNSNSAIINSNSNSINKTASKVHLLYHMAFTKSEQYCIKQPQEPVLLWYKIPNDLTCYSIASYIKLKGAIPYSL